MNDLMTTFRGFDFTQLQKGDVIPVETLEKLFKRTRDKSLFGLDVMALRKVIEVYFASIGDPVTTCQDKGALHVLEDAPASEYNHNAFLSACTGADRAVTRLAAVDAANLNDGEKVEHDKRVRLDSFVNQSIKRSRKKAIKLIGDGDESQLTLAP